MSKKEVKAVNALIADLQEFRKQHRQAADELCSIMLIHDTIRPRDFWRLIFNLFFTTDD